MQRTCRTNARPRFAIRYHLLRRFLAFAARVRACLCMMWSPRRFLNRRCPLISRRCEGSAVLSSNPSAVFLHEASLQLVAMQQRRNSSLVARQAALEAALVCRSRRLSRGEVEPEQRWRAEPRRGAVWGPREGLQERARAQRPLTREKPRLGDSPAHGEARGPDCVGLPQGLHRRPVPPGSGKSGMSSAAWQTSRRRPPMCHRRHWSIKRHGAGRIADLRLRTQPASSRSDGST